MHPKMQYTYVGIDSHKDTHTAVFMDCFFEKLGELTFANLPSKFDIFLQNAQKYLQNDTVFLFGLEDVSSYGRTLLAFLAAQNQQTKHVNALLVARERKNQNIVQKSDAVDAECAARVLLSKFGELPDAQTDDSYWVLRTLVARRSFLVRQKTAAKNTLHSLLTQHYPNYRSFFFSIESPTAMAFFAEYPSPNTLKYVTLEALTVFLQELSNFNCGEESAKRILESLQSTNVEFQEIRNKVVKSTIKQIQFNMEEIEQIEAELAALLKHFNCTLTSMSGISTATAAQMRSCIGDIKKFATPAKLARYAGIAPVTYASGKKDSQFSNQRGNRALNSLFFNLAVRLSFITGRTNRVYNSFFYDYYNRKLSEGKTKRQAIKCVERRLVNIIWTMMTNEEEYVNPPTYALPKNEN